MKCQFCQIEMPEGSGNYSIVRRTCPKCGTRYFYNAEESAPLYYRIFADYKQKKYAAHFNVDLKIFSLMLVDSSGRDLETVFQLDFLPTNITPSTFSNKLPIYLLFL
jgi:hypothetical protein